MRWQQDGTYQPWIVAAGLASVTPSGMLASVKLRTIGLVFALAVVVAPAIARACIWDTETLMQERARFPTALELMTGKFLRHTPEFYAWRIQDRLARIKEEPDNLALVDDLAAAHDKLGAHAEAIAAMEAILPRDPRRYETLANLGTFYMHSGDLERGLEFIDRALHENPDAHFGRERYQRWLAEYMLAKRGADGSLELPLFTREPHGFEIFLAAKFGAQHLATADAQAAVKAVLGMMRFGKHDSPILCEALGDLLNAPDSAADARLLATRAYLMAARATRDRSARAAYEEMAEQAASGMRSFGDREDTSIEGIKAALKRERAEADAWYAELAERELEWIDDSPDPEAEVRLLYAEDPAITGNFRPANESPREFLARHWLVLTVIVAAIVGLAVLGRRMSRPPVV
ncbi:MAG: hypothetical protein H0T76_06045 [Nannocystis sp.]|nr:tetratricopeptide repeat protein [Nannocystis sp.]MBA3546022.1 hypothetical protein [Nannocystis sp.]